MSEADAGPQPRVWTPRGDYRGYQLRILLTRAEEIALREESERTGLPMARLVRNGFLASMPHPLP